MNPKIQLPFGKSDAFPAQAFEPTPERLRMGVEAQARANAPKMPVVNTSVSDRVAALGRNPNVPMPAETAMPFGQPAAAPAQPGAFGGGVMPQPRATVNPLSRGAPAGAASSLGGPVPVGRSRFDPNRMAERMVRRGDPRGAQFLFGKEMQKSGQDFQREMFGAQTAEAQARDATNFEQQQYMFGLQNDAAAARDATNFEQQQYMFGMNVDAANADYERRRADEMADQSGRGVESVEAMPVEGGFVPVVKRKNGTVDMAGGFMPGQKEAPQPSMMQLPGTNDFVPMFGNQQVRGAPIYSPQPTLVPLPDSQAGPPTPGTTLQPKPKDAKADKPVITWGEDPETGKRMPFQQIVDESGNVTMKRVKIVDADGDGVDDRLEQGAAPGGTPPPGAARTTPGGHSVKRVK